MTPLILILRAGKLLPLARHILARFSLFLVCISSSSWAQTGDAAAVMLTPIQVQAEHEAALTAPSTQQARAQIKRIPGGVALVPESAWRDSPAATIKDMLDYTPGVFAQPKWGKDARLSVRGSGLSRYYHTRGISLYQDGVPLNKADGSSDFQWIDPAAYQYTEVYKGANALRYGASTLGGAINFVTPTGHDVDAFQGRADGGSFGWRRLQSGAGFASDTVDGVITGSAQRQDGFREHSAGTAQHVNANLGWRLTDALETRFYLGGLRVRQEIPGTLTRTQALQVPRRAASNNLSDDAQQNVNGVRLANRTVFKAGERTYEFGGWMVKSSLDHPIYEYLDHRFTDYGLYSRLTNTSSMAGHANRYALGVTWSAGKVDALNFRNNGGRKGAVAKHTDDSADNITLYGENAFDLLPGLALITGLQYHHAERKQDDLLKPSQFATRKRYHFFNPKLGLLWQRDQHTQVYANLSRSAEPPTFGDMQFDNSSALDRLKPQRATTLEIGTRGERGDLGWDVSLYHARLKNEYQCISRPWNICDATVNLDRSMHQGLEAGFHWTFLRKLFAQAEQSDSLTLQLAYTFSDFKFDNDVKWRNNRMPGMPRHYLRSELMYQHPAGFEIGPNVEWVPSAYFADNANSRKTASYALLGMRATWERGPYSFFLEGRNLTDRRYIASTSITDRAQADSALFEPGTGRAVYAGVQMRY